MKDVSLDDLAQMVQSGFASVAADIASLRTEIDGKLKELDGRLDSVIHSELDDHAHRLKVLEETALH